MIDRVTLGPGTARVPAGRPDRFPKADIPAFLGTASSWDRVDLDSQEAQRDLRRLGRLFGATDEHLRDSQRFLEANPVLSRCGICAEEVAAIRSYTSGLFEHVNPLLRGNQTRLQKSLRWATLGVYSSAIQAGCRLVASGLNKLPVYEDKDVYRASRLPQEALAAYTPGREVTEKAFTSCSKEPEHTRPGDVMFVIRSKTGRDVSAVAYNSHEEEVLFQPDTRIRVLDRKICVCSRCHRHIHEGLLQVEGEKPQTLRWFDRQHRQLGTQTYAFNEPASFEDELVAWLTAA